MIKRNAVRTAAAAALLLAAAVAWHVSQPRAVFAQLAQAMSRAKGFSCDLIYVTKGYAGASNTKLAGHVFWSPSGEERLDYIDENATLIHRPGATGVRVERASKRYRIVPKSSAREFSFGLFGGLGDYKGKAEPIPRAREIRGVNAKGFTIPWATVIGDDTHSNASIEVWLDPATNLPVRIDLVGLDPTDTLSMRLENFQWGTQDPKLFDASIPAGYARFSSNFKADEITEYVIYGLSTFAKYNDGKYPAVKFVYGDEQGEALRKLMGMSKDALGWVKPSKTLKWDNPKDGEFAHGSFGMSWINAIQRDYPEGVYNGKTVTPQDVTKVLVRWQLDDGDYRVIFGDLSSATVSPTQLRELESR